MPSRTSAFNTAPRLNYRQSKVMETSSDKSIPSSPCYDTNPSDTTGVITEEPYCAAPPPQKSSAVTNKATNTHSKKSGDDVYDKGYTSGGSCSSHNGDCAETLSKTNDSHSLLLRKATSQSSMNLTTLLDNGTPLQHDDIIPRPTKSEPYSFTLIQSEEQQHESDGEPDDNDWNRSSLSDNGGGDVGKEDTTNLEDVIWIKRKSLQTRLFNIIIKTIDHELRRHFPTAANSPRQQQQQLMTMDDDQSPFDKDSRSSDPSGAPSPSSPSPSVSQWWQQQHVALEKTITTQQQVFTTTMGELKRRLDSLERAHHDYILQQQKQQQQQQQQQQTKSQQGQVSKEELKQYNALHARYIDLVTQHSHQLEKYQQLEQAHFSQSNKLRMLELKQPQKPTYRHQQTPPPPSATTMLPSPPLNTIQKQYKTDDQQNINLDQQKKKRNAMDRQQQQPHHYQQQQQQHFRHPHHQYHSNYSPNLTSSPTNAHQQKSRFASTAQPILPTPNASPTSTTIITPPKELATSFANQQPSSTSLQKQQQSFKMDDGYVEFMTECNGEPVLCRVKIPTKDAEMHDGYNNKSSPAEFVSQARQTKPNPRYHPHQYHNNVNNKNMTGRTPSPTTQRQYHTSPPPRQQQHQQQQQQQQLYHQRQGHYQQQQYQYHHTNQYQHPYKPWQAPLPTSNKKTLNPDAPVWTGSWQAHH